MTPLVPAPRHPAALLSRQFESANYQTWPRWLWQSLSVPDVGSEFSDAFKAQINTWIAGSAKSSGYFAREDFAVTIEGQVFTVRYQHQPTYQFRVEFQNQERHRYQIESSPGDVLAQQRDATNDPVGINNALSSWMKRVKTTLELLPHMRAMMEITVRQSAVEDAVKGFPDRFATRQELVDLETRVREIEEQLSQVVHAQASSRAEADERESQIRADFEQLRQQLPSITLRGAVRLALTRLGKYLSDPNTPQQILAAADSLKALREAGGLG